MTARRIRQALIYRIAGVYLSRKLDTKYGLKLENVKDKPDELKKYRVAREKLARDAFLAIRSRTGQDFYLARALVV